MFSFFLTPLLGYKLPVNIKLFNSFVQRFHKHEASLYQENMQKQISQKQTVCQSAAEMEFG